MKYNPHLLSSACNTLTGELVIYYIYNHRILESVRLERPPVSPSPAVNSTLPIYVNYTLNLSALTTLPWITSPSPVTGPRAPSLSSASHPITAVLGYPVAFLWEITKAAHRGIIPSASRRS